ncbi:Biopolymer transport protein ExbD/TolR [Paraburkholderia unamae]|uniref:ExbD/TolR family protein n=1 Tax=Paraburkholderia unamae TaxID=219649 RepID=UPI001CABA29A|nr:Biopolymer transport protein ExbD/TolR [Paraburkholderia unamae]
MAMTTRSSAGAEPEAMVDINTTPLIDVMLVLLIMLIITIPIQTHAVKLDMPNGTPPAVAKAPVVVQIDVAADGAVRWDGEIVADRMALERRMREVAAQADQPELHLRADRLASYRDVAAVMAAAEREGAKRIGLVGNEQYAQ